MKLCVDTCAYTALQHGNESVLELFDTCDELIFPVTVVGELFFGFSNGSRYAENLRMCKSFLEKSDAKIVDATLETAYRYGTLASTLKRNGTPIPQNDIWIAATAMEHGVRLATLDSDFKAVPGLLLELV